MSLLPLMLFVHQFTCNSDTTLSTSSSRAEVTSWLSKFKSERPHLKFDVEAVAAPGQDFVARVQDQFMTVAGTVAGIDIYNAVQKGVSLHSLLFDLHVFMFSLKSH